ncbi:MULTISPECIES: hypothetical protein [unclassified Bradyrhizobium]|uniref:hypothetical protein n=1 Tax=unclassified Bradyrhizobium TaxID=2631580 RepID=UPI001FE1E9C4|nr:MULTISPECIES: hypothetical protein [unclassified Bradyrhizobium]
MIGQLRDGDVVVAWKLDPLSRSLKGEDRSGGCGIAIDTNTPAGRMLTQTSTGMTWLE